MFSDNVATSPVIGIVIIVVLIVILAASVVSLIFGNSNLYLEQEKCIWNNSGDEVYLYDSDGNLIDTQKQH